MQNSATFGHWLRQKRRALDMSQAALARLVGCSSVLIRKLEADERRPSRQIAELLALHLGIAPGEWSAFVRFARTQAPAPPAGQTDAAVQGRIESLSQREKLILQLIAADLSNQQIADRLTLTLNTVRWYLKQMYAKLDLHRRDELADLALALKPETNTARFAAPRRVTEPAPLAAVVHGLPQDIQERYVGRAGELSTLLELIRKRPGLIAVYGRGGTGKTALVCRALSEMIRSEPELRGVVCLSALGTGISLGQVLSGFARLVGEEHAGLLRYLARDAQTGPGHRIRTLIDCLNGGWYLLLLDDLEGLQDEASGELKDGEIQALLEGLLEQGGPLTIVAASRVQLNLRRSAKVRERRIELRDGLAERDAVDLLRRFDADGVAGLRDAPDELLRAVARQTYGYPRALEAVAGLLFENPLSSVEALLRDLPLLRGEVTAAIVRQALAGLGERALEVVQALAVLGRPVPLEALEFLLNPGAERLALQSIVVRLVRSYFVSYNRASQEFSLHPIDQEYCYQALTAGSPNDRSAAVPVFTRAALHGRAADYYAAQRRPQMEWRSLDDLAPSLAEYEHCVRAEDYARAARLLLMMDRDYLWEWGQVPLLQRLYGQLGERLDDAALRRQVQRRLGWLQWPDVDAAGRCFRQVLESARAGADRQAEADALDDLAQTYRRQGDSPACLAHHQAALAIYRKIGDRRGEADALGGIGSALMWTEPAAARSAFVEALALHREQQRAAGITYVLDALVQIDRNLGDFDAAQRSSQEALDLCRRRQMRLATLRTLGGMATIALDLGEYDRAIVLAREALDVCDEIGHQQMKPFLLSWLATGRLGTEDHEGAITLLGEALALSQRYGPNAQTAMIAAMLMRARLVADALDDAQPLVELLGPVESLPPWLLAAYGLLYARLGRKHLALQAFERIRARPNRTERPDVQPVTIPYLVALAQAARALLRGHDLAQAAVSYQLALERCRAPGILAAARRDLGILMGCAHGSALAPLMELLA